MKKLKRLAIGASGLALAFAAGPAASATDGQSAAVSVGSAVASFYDSLHSQPIWFRGNANTAAVAQLTAILQRAPFDGFPEGPLLATQVQAAAAQASSGKPDDIASAERVLSGAWVQYVQALKRPTAGMIYAYPVLQPQGDRADQFCSRPQQRLRLVPILRARPM